MTQKEQVLEYLNTHGSVTSWDVIQTYGVTRLAEYIRLLKKDGFIFRTVNETFGKKTYARYLIISRPGVAGQQELAV